MTIMMDIVMTPLVSQRGYSRDYESSLAEPDLCIDYNSLHLCAVLNNCPETLELWKEEIGSNGPSHQVIVSRGFQLSRLFSELIILSQHFYVLPNRFCMWSEVFNRESSF